MSFRVSSPALRTSETPQPIAMPTKTAAGHSAGQTRQGSISALCSPHIGSNICLGGQGVNRNWLFSINSQTKYLTRIGSRVFNETGRLLLMAQDAAAQIEAHGIGDVGQPQDASKRERSTIQFPYFSMDEAVAVAKGIHAVGGTACQIDQLGAHLNLKPETGSFRLKLAAARLFGLIAPNATGGSIALTPLGSRICDPQQEQTAKAESFLLVPLYQRVYEQFKGASLPPLGGLEAAMVGMGVAPKQKDTARQVFQRSAQYAGFFWSGVGRLVYPPTKGGAGAAPSVDPPPPLPEDIEQKRKKPSGDSGDGNGSDYHPFIAGLLKTLPPADSDWPMDARRKWLQAASTIFEVIYKDSESKGSLRIEVQKDSGR